jgi:hypothetical protein
MQAIRTTLQVPSLRTHRTLILPKYNKRFLDSDKFSPNIFVLPFLTRQVVLFCMKTLYLALAVVGLILPYSQFVPFILENGVNISLIVTEITGYRLCTFAWMDVVITALVVITLVFEEKLKYWWIPVAATLLIGPSCGLPLYLYMRE